MIKYELEKLSSDSSKSDDFNKIDDECEYSDINDQMFSELFSFILEQNTTEKLSYKL